ncbi:hypothetical protein OCUAc17_35310 [Acinetobacter pittii]|uniref:Uncharacterized protein n=1 Tax=Acinetobacter pittii TaxID=48296 RepID=A0A4Y3JBU9_ACIPI|nr:hypothetical protein OH685_03680 [Acinetobacter pittii]BCZ12156.1 hypothetical protein OCUAc17_35310 [Acinetobacter pittii]GEA68665.1 hypothetical protein PA3_28230 [Acinetobacter pittii]
MVRRRGSGKLKIGNKAILTSSLMPLIEKPNEGNTSSKNCVLAAYYNASARIIFRNYHNEKGF